MTKYIVRRFLFMILTMFLASMLIFVVAEFAPGNVVRNIVGQFVSPEQEASYRAQLGLDRPLPVRYVSWLLGSDWQAAAKLGMPLKYVLTDDAEHRDWWAEASDGSYVRWKVQEGELIRLTRQPGGRALETVDSERWLTDEHGVSHAWILDATGTLALLEKGGERAFWSRLTQSGQWAETQVGGVEYIPLQKGLLRGDPGVSIQTGRPVGPTLMRRVRNSATLALLAFVIVMPLALLFGLWAGLKEGRPTDRVLSLGGLVTTATPEFAMGVFLILILSSWLHLLPGATVFVSEDAMLKNPQMLILPVLTLTASELGYVLRITRASMVEVMNTGYIRTAYLKGLPTRRIIFKHALRNALMAPITVIMLHVNWLMGGVLVVEAIFGFPGLGRYIYEAALYKDVFAIEAGAMVMIFLAVTTQLLADIIYTFLNPRIRYS